MEKNKKIDIIYSCKKLLIVSITILFVYNQIDEENILKRKKR